MPELPEVEVLRKYLEEIAIHKDIVNTAYYDDSDRIFKSSHQKIGANLIGNRFEETKRIGKYLFVKISNGKWLHFHFGMTGSFKLFKNQEDIPKYTRFVIAFKDGDKLAFRDSRKFGKIQIIEDPDIFQKENKLGTDLLEIKEKDFIKALAHRKTAIKNALLDQHHFSGIGNWIADEILFRSGIHPKTLSGKLSQKELSDLYSKAIKIAKIAIKHDTHYGNFPEDFFVNYRKKGALHPEYPNSPVEKFTVGGRGTYIVPARQKIKDT